MPRVLAALLVATTLLAQEKKAPELHKIYVPYEKLNEVLGSDEERVMVPYKEFLELWKLKYGPRAAPDKPPVPFTVEAASYQGRVGRGIASFTATIEIEVFEEAWQRIPLSFSGVAFEEVLVDGSPGVLTPSRKGYDLILRGKGRHKVEGRFVAGVAKGKEYATTAFGLPAVPLHRLSFRVPGKGTEVRIEPARAHTTTNQGDDTVLMAFLGPQGSVELTWRYQPEETEKEPSLVFSTDTIDVRVEERVVRGTARFDLDILRAPATEFTVRLPAGIQVLEVTGANLKTWGFRDAARRQLRVVLHKEVTGRYGLGVGFEGPVEVPGTLGVPTFRVEGAAREHGFVRVSSAEGVGIRPVATENVFQIDLNSLPKAIRGGQRALGFRFPALPWSLGVRTEKIAPRVSLVTRARLEVERRRIKLNESFHFQVERAGIFTLELEVPQGIVLTDIGDPKLIDSWRESTQDGKRTLTLDLRGRRIGSFTLPVKAVAPLDLAAGTLEAPLLKVLDIDREEGTLGVFMDPGIKAVATPTGLVPLEPARFGREDNWRSGLPLSSAWRWRGSDGAVSFAVEARKPKVTCDVRYSLHAEEARVRVRADLVYNVQYTGVESFRFRVPKSLVERLKIDGRNIREKPHTDDEVTEGEDPTTTWTVTLQSPALGQVLITAEYDEVFAQPLQTNRSRDVPIPAILPLGVERTNTYAAVRKAPVIKVEAPTTEYEQIDASELPQPLRSDDVFLALRRFDAPAKFPLRLEKHEYQPVADLVVQHTHLETVVASKESATTIAFFDILNNDRQFLAVRLPRGYHVLELRVAGKPEKPRVGAGRVLLVPLLTGLKKDATFQVAIAYKHPIGMDGAVFEEASFVGPELPEYEDAPKPFQALLTWTVHYPSAWRVTGFSGTVEPSGKDAEEGSWLRRAIQAMGRLVQPAAAAEITATQRTTPLGSFEEIVPMKKMGESVQSVFSNGTGDGRLTISHTSLAAEIVFFLLALAMGAAAVVALTRVVKPLHAGGAILLLALLCLAFAGRGWTPIWNGVLIAALVATVAMSAVELRGRKA